MPLDKLFSELKSSPSAQGALGGAASGAMVSLLMNKKARKKIGSSAAAVGGMAALAGVGYLAYKKFQGNTQNKRTPQETPASNPHRDTKSPSSPSVQLLAQEEPAPRVSDRLGLLMIKAMIAATYADGEIDPQEMDGLFASMESANLTPEENRELTHALNNPPTLESIAQEVANEEEAAEIYGAALSAIDPDTPSETFFLRRLAHAMQLDAELVQLIHAESQSV